MHNLLTSAAEAPKFRLLAEGGYLALTLNSSAVLKPGTVVKLNSSGVVVPVAALGDRPIGIVYVGNNGRNKDETDPITVNSRFRMVIKAQALGTVATGDLVDAISFDATNELTKFSTHTPQAIAAVPATVVEGNSLGICLVGGATTEAILVGLF